jgi:para-aminobenzoate synthetase component 1
MNIHQIHKQLPHWLAQFEYAVMLDSNGIASAGGNDSYEFIAGWAGAGARTFHSIDDLDSDKSWKLGYLCFESLHTNFGIHEIKKPRSGFEGVFFFEPETIIYLKRGSDEIVVHGSNRDVLDSIAKYKAVEERKSIGEISQLISKEKYLETVNRIQEHIIEGDFYEMNFCMEFHSDKADIAPAYVFEKLRTISPTPFSCFVKNGDKFLICASPERFIKRTGEKIIAQPIKGTERRSIDPDEDNLLKLRLQHSEKERAENVMIVDLMRNDLAQCANTGSVHVDELFGVYSFATVHQLISTVSATLRPSIKIKDILEKTFPMGSMTGAPKRAVIQAIDIYEPAPRSIFSGSVGYISPDGDLDLNVVIRSIIYNRDTKFISFNVGSAITFDADPEYEYGECLLKAQTMFKALDINPEMP